MSNGGSRLVQLNEATLSDEQRALFRAIVGDRTGARARPRHLVDAAGELQGPYNVMLLAPTLGDPLQRLGGVLRFRGQLSDRARELVILTVARAWTSEFEWWAHVALARDAGVTDAELDAVLDGRVPPVDDPVERAVLDAADALVQRGDLDDDEFAAAEAALGSRGLIELTTLVGYYALVALQLRVFRVGIPLTEERAFEAR